MIDFNKSSQGEIACTPLCVEGVAPLPLLTVVTINKNNAQGLVRTMNSLRDFRKYPEFEFAFIDGASVDDSVLAAKSFYMPTEIISEPDTGIYNAMNKGLRYSRGRYVLWLNSGDEFLPDAHQALLGVLKGNQAAMVGFAIQTASEDNPASLPVWQPNVDQLPWGTFPHPGTCFLRQHLLALGGYDESLKIVGDRDLIMRVFFSGALIETREQVISSFHTGGTSGSLNAYFELLWLRRKHGLLKTHQYHYWLFRYRVKLLLMKTWLRRFVQ